MASLDDTLNERGSRYGTFKGNAEISQGIKGVMAKTPGWGNLTASMKEALEMVAHKVARILNGDPTYIDSWHDIGGYTKLVEQELAAEQPAPPVPQPAPVTAPFRPTFSPAPPPAEPYPAPAPVQSAVATAPLSPLAGVTVPLK